MKSRLYPWFRGAALALAGGLLMSAVQAKEITLQAEVGSPVLEAGKKQTTFLKVGLTGFKLDGKADRAPANIAIVLDKSGSMRGDKLERAKEAATLAVSLLDSNDVVSVVSYDSTVNVLVPATHVGDKKAITAAIDNMEADGSTALFAGVSKGAAEVREIMDKERVNRVILLSDGQANVGPQSPTELGELGASLGKDGISVTTIGLGYGYNEDLMTNLAGYSDGNHAFVENAEDLAKIFQYEFGDVLSVVAQDVEIHIHCVDGVKPLRLLGREGDILGQNVKTRMNQLYSEQEKYVLLEVEVPEGKAAETRELAQVDVVYRNMNSQQQAKLADKLKVAYSVSAEEVRQATNQDVVKEATKQVANETSKQAVQLRDAGKVEEARSLLQESAGFISSQANRLEGAAKDELETYSKEVTQDADQVADEADWNRNRKDLKARQYKLEKQQTY